MSSNWQQSNVFKNVQKITSLIVDFEITPTADKVKVLINRLNFSSGLSTDRPALKLIFHLQILAKAIKDGDVDLTKNAQEIKQNAIEAYIPEEGLKLVVEELIADRVSMGRNFARQHERFNEYTQALNDLRQQFGILKKC